MQKPMQYCKAIILQLKKEEKEKKIADLKNNLESRKSLNRPR